MVCEKLRKYLDGEGAKFEVVRHSEAFTAQELAAALHVSGRMLVKVVVLKTEQGYIMVALPADRRVDIAALRSELGMKLAALASEDEFKMLFPDCEPGAMPPFGNLYGLKVYADKSLTLDKDIYFQAGNHYEVVRMNFDDYERLVKPGYFESSRKAA